MGLLSFIGGGISKIASSISPAITSFAGKAFKAAASIFTSLGNTGGFIGKIACAAKNLFSGTATIIAGPLGPIVGQVVTNLIIAAISKVVEWLSQKTEVIDTEDTVEEVGYRVEEAAKHDDWRKREEFDSFAEYHNYLKGKIPASEIDHDKIVAHRLTYMGLGTTALNEGLESKFGIEIPIEFLIEIGRKKLSGVEVESLIEEFGAKGYNLSVLYSYFQGKLDNNMVRLIETLVFDALKKIYPEKSDDELRVKISDMKNSTRDDVQVFKNYETEFEAVINGENDIFQNISNGADKNVGMVKG